MKAIVRAGLGLLACFALPAAAQYYPEYPEDTTSYTALWWVEAESGWGLNTNHQGNTVFATLFTYARDGQPLWLVGPALGGIPGERLFTGAIYRTTGPAFNQLPWTGIGFSQVGTMAIEFLSARTATLSYTFDGVRVDKTVARQVFGSPVPECIPQTGTRQDMSNYQDLWWNPDEIGWGINLVHQGTTIFATLFTYAPSGRDLWVVGPALARRADGAYSGAIYTTTGPAFDAAPWTGIGFAQAGTMTLRFANGESATLEYTLNGLPVAKNIERQVFGSTVPGCR